MALRDGTETGGRAGYGHKGMESTTYINRVWDPGGGGGYESWSTKGYYDQSGSNYPDPHGSGWGACSDYVIAGIVYYDKVW